ncbi:hypothetical protein GCM10008107_20020 [Psychrosphaera saromensis]|uniref:DUF2798 domain-containing protein n=1 Tax=Psychrosphaera saromensis TaxID=716813 RepID=A0A2S7URX9_9GAMM|nr:DUF2798 domain-containing protein [Psychrosphaera saromensis]PQJ52703.1 hypothetical protein BTO11_02895 [Psychrosphaera saromensis]GHB70571.1 hypothetical protein GCM10008107_20020 [Psychrosphaera saromensis]GLQ13188.1 hypothetical protein GCM10007917_06430 [Psychrosphaera saromensis]
MTKFVFTALFSCCLSCIMSAWVTYINIGLTNDFISRWAVAFINAWPAAFIAAYLLNANVMRVTLFLINTFSKGKNIND